MPEEKKRKKGERADGRIQIRVNIGRDDNGKIKYKYFYGHTKKEAAAKAEAFKLDLLNYGKPLDTTTTTLSEWTYKHLFTNVKPTVQAGTFERYMATYKNRIQDSSIGNMELKDIQPIHLQNFMNNHSDLSKSSLRKIYNLLHASFKSAIANNLIRINPLENVKLPSSEVKQKEIEILTLDEQKAYMKALDTNRDGILFLTALLTGMRIGELLALKWDNVDLNTGTITVCETLRRVKVYDDKGNSESKILTKCPKTEKGYRSIPIPKTLVLALKKYQLASYNSEEGLVFCTKSGLPFQYNYVWYTHKALCKKANIRETSIHALRHTFASRSIEAGIDVKTVSDLLGHANTQITWNTYVHSTNDSKREAANTMENIYKNMLL